MSSFVGTTAKRAPLYSRLASALADEEAVLDLLAEAPAPQRIPVTLFAAVHDLLLADPGEPLAAYYPNLTPGARTDDPAPAFLAFCAAHRDDIVRLVRTRVPQTNEVGRSALLLVALALLGDDVGTLAQVDVGASAGLNLLTEHYGYDYAGYRLGPDRLVLPCAVRGNPTGRHRLPRALPAFTTHLGLDANPVDLNDPEQVRWLEACVWPDQTDRFHRLQQALAIAREVGVTVRSGDAVDALASTLATAGPGHPVVTTSWVLSYLSSERRASFVAALEGLGAQADLSWIFAEAPAYAPGLPYPAGMEESDKTVLGLVRWRGGRREVDHLAVCHPHGYWLSWL